MQAPTFKAADFTMFGVNFEDCGTTGAVGIPINKLFGEPSQGTFTGGDSATIADRLLVPKINGGYEYYYFTYFGEGLDDFNYKWFKDGEFAATEDVILPGTAIWFDNKSSSAIQNFALAGQVSTVESYELNVRPTDMTMFASPYPINMPLNGSGFDWSGAKGGDSATVADRILVAKPDGGYEYYYYTYFGEGMDEYNDKWFKDGEFVATPDSLPVGAAAWYDRKDGDVTFTIFKPYTL